jgi:tRNA pseudouridine38-40 synthase
LTLFDLDDGLGGPEAPPVRVRMTVAYDGSGFHGFAANRDVRTVAGVLGDAIGRVLGHPVTLTCAGRTDKGVHARGQVVSFDTPRRGLDLESLQRSLNGMCGPEVVVRDAAPAPPGFDARRSARSRRYRYTVLNRPVSDPFLSRTAWHIETPLDLNALRLCCDPLHGEHDFSAFCRRPRVAAGAFPPSMVRRVTDAGWRDLGDGILRFEIEASSFCQQMVRSVVGTMVDAGAGRRRAGEMADILRCRDRQASGQLAPARGLCLWEVTY